MSKKLLSLMIAFAVLFTTVFAGTGAAFAADSSGSFVPFNYNTVDWTDDEEIATLVEEKAVVVTDSYPVKVTKKGHYFSEFSVVGSSSGYATVKVVNSYGTVLSEEEIYLSSGGDGYYYGYTCLETQIEKTGTYTVEVETDSEGYLGTTYIGYYLPQSTKTNTLSILNMGEKIYDNPSSGYSWFKVKVDGIRNLKIQLSEEGTFQVRLYKSDKSTVLGGGTVYVGSGKNYTTYYAVPKGTYYVRIYKKESVTPYYGIKMSTSKVTEKSGSSKSTAATLSKNTTKKGTLLTSQNASSSADWYKVTLTKSQKFYMHLNFKTGGISKGGVKISVYKKGQSSPVLTKKFASGESSYDWNLYTTGNDGKLEKGTYYFKVQKYNYCTGYYSLKWNNSKQQINDK